MKLKFYVLLLTVLFVTISKSIIAQCIPTPAQTFTNSTPVAIPTVIATVTSSVVVSGAPTFLYDVNLLTNITHTFCADLDITLTSPAGTVVTITSDNGGANDNVFNGTLWNDNANPAGQVPYTTNAGLATDHPYVNLTLASPLAPEEGLGAFIGENPNGTWTLTISDDAGGDGGSLASWSLIIQGLIAPPPVLPFSFSNNTPVVIPTTISTVSSTINVVGAGPQLIDLNLLTNITHTFCGDLDITLTSPAGTVVTITTDNGGANDNVFNGTLWDDDANPAGQVPYTTNNGLANDHAYVNLTLASPLAPEEALAAFVGENPNGIWTLTISDDAGGDGGSLASWSLDLVTANCPPPPCTLTCPANITVSNDAGQCGAVVNYPPATTSGTCGTITYSIPSGSVFPVGTTTVIVSSSIGGGICTFTVTVNDAEQPTFTSCPSNITTNSTGSLCGAVVNYTLPTATDNCPGVVVTRTAGLASGSTFPVGTTTVTHIATDASGNLVAAPCTFTVTVVDVTPPVITCPAPIVVGSDAGQCGAVVNFTVGSTDNCASATLTQSTSNVVTPVNSISCNAGGLHAENSYWRAYQLALPAPVAVNSVTFGIETANAAGVGTTQPVNVRVYTSAGAFPGGVRTQVASQTFNIPDQSGTLFTASFTTPPTVPGNAILVLEVNTPDGQAAGHSFFIGTNSAGQSAPSYISATACGLTSPGTFASVGFPNVHIILNASVSGSVPVVSVPASGSVFPVGTTTVTSTATDAAGNTAQCTFTVTVNDTQAPSITCPANVTRTTDVGVCTATFAPNTPTSSDNCAVTVQTWALTGATVASSPATGINTVGSRAFNLGVTTVTYTVRDAAGNSTSCSFTVTITDALLPTITAQPVNRTVCAGTTATFSVTAVTAPTAGGPLAYQWQQWNGTAWVNVAGATASSYSVANTTQSMNTNTFRVAITGLCSVVNSSAATLFVNALPTISLSSSINSPVLIPGQVTNIIANVSPTGGTFAWFKNGAPRVPTVTTGMLSNLTVDDAGTYRATYTDPNGCVSTSADLVISAEVTDRLFVAPNPNFGQFWVRYYNQTGESLTVVVFDSKGRRVHQQQSATGLAYTRIDVDMGIQAAGIYVVELRGTGGRLLGRKQMIVAQR